MPSRIVDRRHAPRWITALALACLLSQAQAQRLNPPPDPDVPEDTLRGRQIDREAYLQGRAEQIGMYRGLHAGVQVDPAWRMQAVTAFERSLAEQMARGNEPAWTPLGPAPIPNGQTVGTVTPVSGRVIAIAIHPTNPDVVFVGTASGGLYRSLDGGDAWAPLMDSALSLSIGALALAPSDPDTLYVGTGEHNFSADSFFGVGVYRIENATSVTPSLLGPFNLDVGGADVLSGRGISRILVHPTDADTIFVATTSGVGGIGAQQAPNLPSRGLYRALNGTSADVRFEKLSGLADNANSSVRDIAFDPADPNILIANVVAADGVGGLYRSADALAVAPSFIQTEVFNSSSTNELTAEFATFRDPLADDAVFYAAVGNGGGRVLISTDGGASWAERIDNDFCTPQCFYDIAIAVDPMNVDRVYLGGSPAIVFARSNDGGASFAEFDNGLHVDSHVIEVAPSNSDVLYFGSDGGIYRSDNAGQSWIPLNNADFSATQFMGLATHAVNYNVTLGGTQDNGTNLLRTDGSWRRADGGDGGFTGIDQNASGTTAVRMYHTYFNAVTLQGYATTVADTSANNYSWDFRGCQGGTVAGISCNGSILFYAPLVLGPGNPNTVYYGSDRLYRSADSGQNHTVVSQNPLKSGVPISAIAIAPNDDGLRVVGLRDGSLFRTLNGSSVLEEIDAFGAGSTIPDAYIGRIAIDPADNNIVYVALAAFSGAGQNLWKSTDFLSPTPTFSAAASGIPNVPVNALALDPDAPGTVYAGTDVGVYRSTDAGASWSAFGVGLPRVPVFGLAFAGPQNPLGKGPLRAATHGRGIWEIDSGTTPLPDFMFEDGFE